MRLYIRPATRSFLELINVDHVFSFSMSPSSGGWNIVANSGSGPRTVIVEDISEREDAERLTIELAALTGWGDANLSGSSLIEWDGSKFTLRHLSYD